MALIDIRNALAVVYGKLVRQCFEIADMISQAVREQRKAFAQLGDFVSESLPNNVSSGQRLCPSEIEV